MSYEDWRPRRNQSRSTKTMLRRMKRRQGIFAPATWLQSVPVDPSASLTLEEMRRLRGLVTIGASQTK